MTNSVNKTLVAGAMALTFAAGLAMVSSPADAHMHKTGSYTDSYSYSHSHIVGHPVARAHTPKYFVFTGGYAFVGNYALCYPEPNSPAYKGCTYLGHTPSVAATTGHLAPALPYTAVGFTPFGYQPYPYQYDSLSSQPYPTSYGVYGY